MMTCYCKFRLIFIWSTIRSLWNISFPKFFLSCVLPWADRSGYCCLMHPSRFVFSVADFQLAPVSPNYNTPLSQHSGYSSLHDVLFSYILALSKLGCYTGVFRLIFLTDFRLNANCFYPQRLCELFHTHLWNAISPTLWPSFGRLSNDCLTRSYVLIPRITLPCGITLPQPIGVILFFESGFIIYCFSFRLC